MTLVCLRHPLLLMNALNRCQLESLCLKVIILSKSVASVLRLSQLAKDRTLLANMLCDIIYTADLPGNEAMKRSTALLLLVRERDNPGTLTTLQARFDEEREAHVSLGVDLNDFLVG